MKIRFATTADVPGFVQAGQQIHATTHLTHHPYDGGRVARTLQGIIDQPHGRYCFIVAVDNDDAPVGWIIGCMEQHFFSGNWLASIVNYGVLPERRMSGAALKLLTAFRKWAENRGASEINAGVNSGVDLDKMDRFLRKLGFRQTGGNYSIGLQASY